MDQSGAKWGDFELLGAISSIILYDNYKSILKIFIRVDTFLSHPRSNEPIWGYGANCSLSIKSAALYLQTLHIVEINYFSLNIDFGRNMRAKTQFSIDYTAFTGNFVTWVSLSET